MTRLAPSCLLTLLLCIGCADGPRTARDGATGGLAAPAPGAPTPEAIPARRFSFTYSATIPAPPDTRQLRIWIPLPHEDPGVQEVAELEIVAPEGHRVTTEQLLGNRMVYAEVQQPEEPVQVGWSAVITRYEDRGQGILPDHPRYLEPTRLIPLAGKARELALALGVLDPDLSLEERATRIYEDVLNGMRYDKSGQGWGRGDFNHAVEVCEGNCTDFHARFMGVARAAGIPVRFTMGIPMKSEPRGTYNSYHCWAHWYDGARWRPVDISEADKIADSDPERATWFNGHLTVDRIGLTFGRDLTLEPPQDGEPLNFLVFPYAEADGTPVPMSKSEHWFFEYADQP